MHLFTTKHSNLIRFFFIGILIAIAVIAVLGWGTLIYLKMSSNFPQHDHYIKFAVDGYNHGVIIPPENKVFVIKKANKFDKFLFRGDNSVVGSCWIFHSFIFGEIRFILYFDSVTKELEYHEMGHCYLDLPHTDRFFDIMYPYTMKIDKKWWKWRVEDYFEQYKKLRGIE